MLLSYTHIYIMYFDYFHPPSSSPFPYPSQWLLPTVPLSHFVFFLWWWHGVSVFVFLSLTYLTQHDARWFHPFSCKWHNEIYLRIEPTIYPQFSATSFPSSHREALSTSCSGLLSVLCELCLSTLLVSGQLLGPCSFQSNPSYPSRS
jgi:hypothetical protein